MSNSTLPTEEHVQSLFTDLFGGEVPVKAIDSPELAKESTVRASYVNDEGALSKLLVCDLAFACRVGAALTRIPSGTVNESIKEGNLPENIRENLQEVLNICVNLFPATNGTRVVFDKIEFAGDENGICDESTDPQETIAFEVDIPRYGTGVFSLKQVSSGAAQVPVEEATSEAGSGSV